MPIISRFFGIIKAMYWRDHVPPHFHAKYGDQEIIVEIETGKIKGNISKRALSLIKEWREYIKKNCRMVGNWPSKTSH